MNEKNLRKPIFFPSFRAAIRSLYQKGQGDETLEPIVKVTAAGQPVGRLKDGDVVIFYDLRGEREIELSLSLTEADFAFFPRPLFPRLHFVTLVDYSPGLKVKVAFPADNQINNTLIEAVGRAGFRVVKIAETEKAPHVGYFLNGKRDEAFPGEERIIIPSSSVSSYEAEPEMKAELIAEEVVKRVREGHFNLLVANLANVDVVGHTECRSAVIKAVETVDRCLGRIASVCREHGVCLVITADHGTVEEWLYPDGAVNTGHTKNPVPFILCDWRSPCPEGIKLRPEGELADVAPTILDLLRLRKPEEMTGRSLLLTPTRDEDLEASDNNSGLKKCLDKKGGDEKEKEVPSQVVLLILDGWGIRDDDYGNLIAASATPNFDFLWDSFPHAQLQAAGEAVGLPPGTVGNSEAGHLHLGAGRRVFLDRVRIDRSLIDGSFFQNEVLSEAMNLARLKDQALHLMGIVSHYSSHGTIRHLFALLQMAQGLGLSQVYIHAFIGRRGERPESGVYYVEKIEEKAAAIGCGQLVTVMGRFWSLDREANWDRIEKAYRALVMGEGHLVCPEGQLI